MTRPQPPWARLVELPIGVAGHLLAWEKNEADGTWQAWVSWAHETGRRRAHQVVQARAASCAAGATRRVPARAPPGARPRRAGPRGELTVG